MALNQFYFDHQVLLMQTEFAGLHSAKQQPEVRASRMAVGATAAPVWEALAAVNDRSPAPPVRHRQGCFR